MKHVLIILGVLIGFSPVALWAYTYTEQVNITTGAPGYASTTNVLNLGTQGVNDPSIYLSSTDPSGARWAFNTHHGTFNGVQNNTLNWGWNNGLAGCKLSGVGCFYEQLESSYNNGQTEYFEYHLNYFAPTSTVKFRPFGINVDKNTNKAYIGFKGETSFVSSDGTKMMMKIGDGGDINMGKPLIFSPNNSPILYQTNTSGGSQELFRLNNQNKLNIYPPVIAPRLSVTGGTSATATVEIGSIGRPGCLKMRAADNSGWLYMVAQEGASVWTTTSCE